MHYDLESDSRLAWASFPYFQSWDEFVVRAIAGSSGPFHLMPGALAGALRANVAIQQAIGIDTRVVGPDEVARLCPAP